MLEKKITYTDFNGQEKTRTFYFNLTKAQAMEMELSVGGGLSERIKKITETQDVPAMIEIFKDIILKAYGEKSDDGERFIKSPALSEAFAQTEAYSELFMELATNSDSATAFINGIVPNMDKPNIPAPALTSVK